MAPLFLRIARLVYGGSDPSRLLFPPYLFLSAPGRSGAIPASLGLASIRSHLIRFFPFLCASAVILDLARCFFSLFSDSILGLGLLFYFVRLFVIYI